MCFHPTGYFNVIRITVGSSQRTWIPSLSWFCICPYCFDISLKQATYFLLVWFPYKFGVLLLLSLLSLPWELILRVSIVLVPRLEVLIIHTFSSFFCHIKLIDYLPVVTTEGNSYPFNTCKNRILKSRLEIARGKKCLSWGRSCSRPAVKGAILSPQCSSQADICVLGNQSTCIQLCE